MKKVQTIANYTFKDALRNNILFSVIIFSAVLILFSALAAQYGDTIQPKVMVDFSMAIAGFFGTIITFFLTLYSFSSEIEQKTIYLCITRPISTFVFVSGKWFGIFISVAFAYFIMYSEIIILCIISGYPVKTEFFLSFLLSMAKFGVLAAIIMFLSLFLSRVISATIAAFLYIYGHTKLFVTFAAHTSGNKALDALVKAANIGIPDFSCFDISNAVIYHFEVPLFYCLQILLYGALLCLFLLLSSALVLEGKDL